MARKRLGSKQSRLEDRIHRLHDTHNKAEVRLSSVKFSIGKLLCQLRDTVIKPGEWKFYLEGKETLERLGFSASTAYRYLAAFERATEAIEPEMIELLQREGIDLASPVVLEAVLAAREEGVEVAELPEKVKNVLTMRRKNGKNGAHGGPTSRVDKIYRLLVALYRKDDVQKVVVEVNTAVDQWRAWKEDVALSA